jgi:hypothetical protein
MLIARPVRRMARRDQGRGEDGPGMDMDCMDVETIQETWILARHAWDLARRQQRRRQAAGEPLTDAEDSSLRRARADFQAAERLWDEAYRAGIVIAVDERDDAGLTGLYQQVVPAPPDNAPRLGDAEQR